MNLKVHHLSCGSLCPWAGDLLFPTKEMCCHCLLIETDRTLVMVDTGLPAEEVFYKNQWLRKYVSHPRLDPMAAAAERIRSLGFKPQDVGHVILTHLDWDHAGGLTDFPKAILHLHRQEARYLRSGEKLPFRYDSRLWKHSPALESYEKTGEKWNGFDAVRPLKGLPPEILLMPLPGHTSGHSGVVVDTGTESWFHAGDSFFFLEDLNENPLRRNRASDAIQALLAQNNLKRLATLWKLSRLRQRHPEVRLMNSHDPRLLPADTGADHSTGE